MFGEGTILFLHGLESGPHGGKYHALCRAGWTVEAPDCTAVSDIRERVVRARASLRTLDGPVHVVGSSFGGLAAVFLWEALEASERTAIATMLLLAPALHLELPQRRPVGRWR
jgi:alpha-beta hydrolase superfamily lysophospholipase